MLVWAKKVSEDGERGKTEYQDAVQAWRDRRAILDKSSSDPIKPSNPAKSRNAVTRANQCPSSQK
jgi:hypothetical protein